MILKNRFIDEGIYPEYHISGTNFSPKKLKQLFPRIIFSTSHESADISQFGLNKGKPHGYGHCKIIVPEKIINKIEWLAKFIIKNNSELKKLGVTDKIIWIYWVGIQGNMEFSRKELQLLHQTKLNVAMNYIYKNDTD